MTAKYRPLASQHVPASSPHPPGTGYRVSAGIEQRDNERALVCRVEMMHNGTVCHRRVPSFPFYSDDAERVAQALNAVRGELAGRLLQQQEEKPVRVATVPAAPATPGGGTKQATLVRRKPLLTAQPPRREKAAEEKPEEA